MMRINMIKNINLKTTLTGSALALLIWLVAAAYDYALFYDDFSTSLLNPHVSDMYYRIIIVFITVISAVILGSYQSKNDFLKARVTEEKRQREDAQYALKVSTVIDVDSGLFTQLAAMKFLEHEINQFKRFKTELSVVFLELDGFTSFLENEPPEVIEKLKHEISEMIKKTIRRSDMVGHWGSDNYILVAVKTDYEQAKIVESKVRLNMNKIIDNYKNDLQVITGITQFEESDSTIDFLNKISSCSKVA